MRLSAIALCASLSVCPALLAGQADDARYGEEIRKHTTRPEFLNSLVDHLPASPTVPSPLQFLGYVPGTPGKLTYAKDVHAYFRALAEKSDCVRIFTLGTSEEGREMLLVAIADPATLRDLERYKEVTRRLSDPRSLPAEEASRLIAQGKPMYWLTGAVHSPETGSPEMLMELAYRLAVEDSPEIRAIRERVITLITPVVEVDGRERMLDTIRWWQENPKAGLPPLVYWGRYVAHDNNRDAISMGLAMTRSVLKGWLTWHPQVLHDLHESIPFLYVSTGTGPYNAWLDPLAVDTWRTMSQHDVTQLTRAGMPGVWNHGFYDGWAPTYLFYVAHGHNGIGRFYETFGNSTPDTRERRVDAPSERAWYRTNPPYPVVTWSLRNNINYQQSGVLQSLSWTAMHAQELLDTYYRLGQRAVAKARTEGPAAYVVEAGRRGGQVRNLLDLLTLKGIEVHRMKVAASIQETWPPATKKTEDDKDKEKDKDKPKDTGPKKIELAAGSYVVRMDQPYSRLADMLLDTQYYRTDDPRPYDDTGWTFGYSKNVSVQRIVNPAILDVAMERVTDFSPKAKATPKGAVAILPEADIDLYRWLWKAKPTFRVAQSAFKVKDRELPAGTLLLEGGMKDADGYALQTVPLGKMPDVATREGRLPRVALLHTWFRTQDEGWYRLALESLEIPYAYISTQDVAKDSNLRARYDAILFPPCGCDVDAIVWGMPPGPPIPWKKTELTPHLGVPDETDDVRPGLGLEGVANLRRFVSDGGTLVTVDDTTELAIQYGLARWVEVIETDKLRAPGTLLRAEVAEPRSPIAYGYDATVPVYFAGGHAMRVGVFHPPEEARQRPTGRGGKEDPDVPQGRAFVETPVNPDLAPEEEGWVPVNRDVAAWLPRVQPPVDQRPRVVLRFAKKASDLWLSGMLGGGEEIAGKAAVVDAPLDKGRVVLFGINPMWRQQTQGMFALVLNALLHGEGLGTGWGVSSTPLVKSN